MHAMSSRGEGAQPPGCKITNARTTTRTQIRRFAAARGRSVRTLAPASGTRVGAPARCCRNADVEVTMK
eukprot:2121382-Pleurochrysis_carterae.AAC.1